LITEKKRVGIALSDQSEMLAFPHSVCANTKHLVDDIVALQKKEGVNIVILGHSTTLSGADNPVQEDIRAFKEALEARIGIPVIFEREWLSSQEAKRFTGKNDMLDASAAAIILQRFLDKKRSTR
jgi:putative Holliday junction resolvase